MTPKQFVAMQLAKRFTARRIPDIKPIQECRKHTCIHLSLGREVAHAAAAFNADWLYEDYRRFRHRPELYYDNAVLPWETILKQTA